MQRKVGFLLAGMMFLEYAAWGAWMAILSGTLSNRGFAPEQIGVIISAFWMGCLLSPFLGGQLVDRVMSSQLFLSISHALCAVAAFAMAYQTTASGLTVLMLVWSLLFAPSLGITNSISFRQIDKISSTEAARERIFSVIRTAGTIGWIAAAGVLFIFNILLHTPKGAVTGPIPELLLTGIFNLVMAVFSLFLPDTPPMKDQRADPFAFRKAFRLFKEVPGFAVFMWISFFAATEFMFFYNLSPQFLISLNIPYTLVPITKAISQVAEVGALAILLPLWLPKKGMKWCLLVGSFAWPLRYLIFAIAHPVWLVVLSLGLHGFGYAFVLVVQQLYVDRVSPSDIRASAQSLLTIMTLGVGNVLGALLSGIVQEHFTHNVISHGKVIGQVTDWAPVFILPAATTLICAFAYMITFKDSDVEAYSRDSLDVVSSSAVPLE